MPAPSVGYDRCRFGVGARAAGVGAGRHPWAVSASSGLADVLEHGLPLGGPQLLVLDSGVIYNDIVFRLRHPERRGVLLGSAERATSRLLAADHVFDEIYDRLDGHERRGVTPEAVIGCFERDYLRLVRFVELPLWPPPVRVAVVGARDPDDAATAMLALLVAPSLVFSLDAHLVDAGFGRREDWLRLAWQADEVLAYDGTLVLGGWALGRAGRWLRDYARRLTEDTQGEEVLAGMTLAMVILAALPGAANAIDKRARRVLAGARRVAVETVTVAGGLAVERGRRTLALQAAAVEPDLPSTLATRAARELALADCPQSTAQLAATLRADSHALAGILGAHRAFVPAAGAWQLGRHRLPRGRLIAAASG